MTLDLDRPLIASRDHTFCELGGEGVILSVGTGTYFGLNALGTRLWQLLQRPQSVGELREVITREFAVSAERCDADLLVFIDSLQANGLLESCDGARP